MLGTHLVNIGYEHAKYRTLAHYTCHVYLTPQTMDEITALKYAYAHTRQTLCGVEGLEQTVSDELFIHSRAVILNFHDGKAGSGQQPDSDFPSLAGCFLGILYQVFKYCSQPITVTRQC